MHLRQTKVNSLLISPCKFEFFVATVENVAARQKRSNQGQGGVTARREEIETLLLSKKQSLSKKVKDASLELAHVNPMAPTEPPKRGRKVSYLD
jgi:hypothetical protein